MCPDADRLVVRCNGARHEALDLTRRYIDARRVVGTVILHENADRLAIRCENRRGDGSIQFVRQRSQVAVADRHHGEAVRDVGIQARLQPLQEGNELAVGTECQSLVIRRENLGQAPWSCPGSRARRLDEIDLIDTALLRVLAVIADVGDELAVR